MGEVLSGVRVLDLSRFLAGPYGSMWLADLGAEVIKIEDPHSGDEMRSMPPYFVDGLSAYFISINRNKKSITLDLKKERGREIFFKLVECSHVVYENYRPGAMERMGIDYERLKEINPKIIMCSISGFGQYGPYRDYPAFDLILQAMGGAMSFTGEAGRVPVRMGIPLGDLAGGMMGAYAVVAALYAAEKTGEGRRIDISLLDGQISLLTYVAQYYFTGGEVPQPIGSGHQSVVPYQAFRTKDIYIVIAVFAEKFWAKLCRVVDRPDLIDDPKFNSNAKRLENKKELIPILEDIFLRRTGEEWLSLMEKEGIPSAPINTVDRILNHPYAKERKMVIEMRSPSGKRVKTLGNPFKMAGAKEENFIFPPFLGQHNQEVYGNLLGYTEQDLKKLKEEGII